MIKDGSAWALHDRPPGLPDYAPPYPAVLIVHGGAASQEMYLWGAEALAESGYMVMTFQIPEPENAAGDAHYPDAKAALDWLLATPASPVSGRGFNPRWAELDREHVGLAGHSAGGAATTSASAARPPCRSRGIARVLAAGGRASGRRRPWCAAGACACARA